MTTATRPRTDPDLDAEREVDVGRYLDALIARWWLPIAGLVAGALIGYLLALGGNDVFRSQATIYVGQPLGPGGNTQLQGPATNPSTIVRIARGEQSIALASARSGMSRRELRSGISTSQVRSGLGRLVASQLYVVSVKGSKRGEVNAATDALARRVVNVLGGYARVKIQGFERQLTSIDRQLAAIERVTSSEKLSTVEALLVDQRRGTLEQERLQTQQLLAAAEQIEAPQIIDRGGAAKATARSTRNSAAIAGLIGFILGILAALLWEPVATRTGKA